jgi:hypothetical protein
VCGHGPLRTVSDPSWVMLILEERPRKLMPMRIFKLACGRRKDVLKRIRLIVFAGDDVNFTVRLLLCVWR